MPDVRWEDKNNRRNFFEEYAKKHCFDPLKPENWYHQTRAIIVQEEVILMFFKNELLVLIRMNY